MKIITIGKDKTKDIEADRIGGEIMSAIIDDIATTQGEWKKVKYTIELEINIDEPELQIRSIIIKPTEGKPKKSSSDMSDIFQEELKKL